MSEPSKLDVSWLRQQQSNCFHYEQRCLRRTHGFWVWATGQRKFWEREASFWHDQRVAWVELIAELEAAANRLEDEMDAVAVEAHLADPAQVPIPWPKVKERLGLETPDD